MSNHWTCADNTKLSDDYVIEQLRQAHTLAVDTETNSQPWYRGICGVVSIAWGCSPNQSVATRSVDYACSLLSQFDGNFVFHNSGFDLHFLAPWFTPKWGKVHDTLLMSRLRDNLLESHGLKELGQRLFGIEPSERDELKAWITAHRGSTYLDVPDDILLPYAAQDTALTFRLWKLFSPQFLNNPVYKREMKIRQAMFNVETLGIDMDTTLMNQKRNSIQRDDKIIIDNIFEYCGKVFNINSDQQLGRYLHDEPPDGLGLPVINRTEKTGRPQVNNYCLTMQDHPFCEMVKSHNDLTTILSYLESYSELLSDQNRLHPTINTLQAVTGRMSSSEPNIQQVKRRGDKYNIRELFTGGDGFLIEADYDKQEIRIAAELAHEEMLLNALREGRDIYVEAASAGFNVSQSAVTTELRDATKIMVLAYLYGAGKAKLAWSATVNTGHKYSDDQAADFRSRLAQAYPNLSSTLKSISQQVKMSGYIQTPLGRTISVNPEFSYKAFNAAVQGTAADETKVAILRLEPILKSYGARLLYPVHDSILTWSPELPSNEFLKEFSDAMNVGWGQLPSTVHIKYGSNWGNMKTWEYIDEFNWL